MTRHTRHDTDAGQYLVAHHRIDEDDMEWELLPIDGDTYGIFAVDADEDADPIRTAQGDEIDELDREVAEHNAGRRTAHADSVATTETITATVRDDGALLWRCEERGPRGGRKVLWAPRTATQSKPNEFAIWSHRAQDVDPLDVVIQGVR